MFAEKAPGARALYNVYIILGLDLVLAILWLASMAAVAHLRSDVTHGVDVPECFEDGHTVTGTCHITRDLERRQKAVATGAGLAKMSAIAALSAIEM